MNRFYFVKFFLILFSFFCMAYSVYRFRLDSDLIYVLSCLFSWDIFRDCLSLGYRTVMKEEK